MRSIGDGDPRAWLLRLIARRDAGEVLTAGQRHCLKSALENLGFHVDGNGSLMGAAMSATEREADVDRTGHLKSESARQTAAYAKAARLDLDVIA